uniref:hypothetical protein n=1 Tax=Aeromonas veronii TaxID=654 RepID=UPI003D1A9F8E
HILTEWPFCYVKSAIEHKRRYAHRFVVVSILFLDLGAPFLGSDLVLYETVFIETAQQTQAFKKLKHQW